ncbi:hypothetical protein GCM10007063_15000 [Lentibacillus kapialis]|uniref:Uncharacterized protein n=1 Tax=Lentibacillus kapialis TaxID=340214 RepID=A0A917PVD2_9BACI|nr:hypothetical protein GCM10007063_15000 [Lentibacillus kapialis]
MSLVRLSNVYDGTVGYNKVHWRQTFYLEAIKIKGLVYQIVIIGLIWTGMAFFFQKMDSFSKFIFYAATSWLLFLIVILIKQLFKTRHNDEDS